MGTDPIHSRVRAPWSVSSLMLLGYSLQQWDLRALFWSLIVPRSQPTQGVAIQLEPGETEKGYLERYLQEYKFEVVWDTAQGYLIELYQHLKRASFRSVIMTPARNPYVGPRTFSSDPKRPSGFLDSDREARDLLSLVISQRLVLFYAQSGAGKSSLIDTRLIPGLKGEGFEVLPIGRVGGELPEGVTQVDNIFLYNLMLSLDRGRDGHGGDPHKLVDLGLSEFLDRLTTNDGSIWYYEDSVPAEAGDGGAGTGAYTEPNYVLIVDQFEEIITTYPDLWQKRSAFFSKLDAAMRADPKLWVVLTLREDHLAALDPFASLMADNLRARFYMERMGVEAALEAVARPAALYGRPFDSGAADELVRKLRQIRVL